MWVGTETRAAIKHAMHREVLLSYNTGLSMTTVLRLRKAGEVISNLCVDVGCSDFFTLLSLA